MSTPLLTVADIRQTFLDFFAERGHTLVPSSSLVPQNDPTLMFTNSGMVQFKHVFLGTDRRSYVRAASVQACLRAGGKHNDLENVGYTARHHTFFEMLGNWSFGDYFKRESLQWAWQLLTEVYGLPADRLWATVYAEDEEAYQIWTQDIGLPAERVIRIGDNKGGRYKSDNFWMMADTGPCGPCSEIFYDHGEGIFGGPPGSPDEDGDRFIEIWNNVFMQFDMKEDGSLSALPAPCVDTGMGLERLAAILQGVHSNYEIDLFVELIQAAADQTACADLSNPSLRVIADHLRACSFLISDGVIPGNEGRAYVLRRIIRRAIRHGYKLGQKQAFFYRLVPVLIRLMGPAYPHLASQASLIEKTLQIEEERFYETLEHGMGLLDQALAQKSTSLDGALAFKLHDTYGFPLDLTQDICRERQITVDVDGFNAAMTEQKNKARALGKFKMNKQLDYSGPHNTFVGYDSLSCSSCILGLYHQNQSVSSLAQGQEGIVIVDKTPFYAESGGQMADQGTLSTSDAVFIVHDVQKISEHVFAHYGKVQQGALQFKETVLAQVDVSLRKATSSHHSATHLLHKVLRDVLGAHVQQKGSLVNGERTRFDFSHHSPLSEDQIKRIEDEVNRHIFLNEKTQTQSMTLKEAQESGAMMLFGEKYEDQVRVLKIGPSIELCGGTHVQYTGDIGLFKIVSETGVAAGIRRIEAIAGFCALQYMQQLEKQAQEAAQWLKAPIGDWITQLKNTLDQHKSLEKQVLALKSKIASHQSQHLMDQAIDFKNCLLLFTQLHDIDAKTLRDTASELKDKYPQAILLLACAQEDKVQLVAAVGKQALSQIKASELVNVAAQYIGGKGGGKPDLAMAAGPDVAALKTAFEKAQQWLQAQL